MHFTTTLLVAIASLGFASAADICPPVFCEIGGRCDFEPDGSHCCSGSNDVDVVSPKSSSHHVVDQGQLTFITQLQCNEGVWQIRNSCAETQFCSCTGSDDLICSDNARKLNGKLFKA